ncbi:nitrogen regulatory protein P-II [Spirochaetia bacterium]|nr:nitrogen regulatory protein P-II [Spirochaetia bacterium]
MANEIKARDDQIRLKAMFIIVDWDRVKPLSAILEKAHCPFCFVSKGSGTANSEILDILGIGATDKAVFLCLAQSSQTAGLVQAVRHSMGSRSAGAGIAFTIPLSGVNALIMKMFEDIHAEALAAGTGKPQVNTKETKMEAVESIEIKNDMIISILNAGYSDAFMSAARKAGARGGTVLSARGLSQQIATKFLGISVQEEKEIVIILAQSDTKVAIMQAISAGFGTSTKAAGLIFSLPVDQVMSLNELS